MMTKWNQSPLGSSTRISPSKTCRCSWWTDSQTTQNLSLNTNINQIWTKTKFHRKKRCPHMSRCSTYPRTSISTTTISGSPGRPAGSSHMPFRPRPTHNASRTSACFHLTPTGCKTISPIARNTRFPNWGASLYLKIISMFNMMAKVRCRLRSSRCSKLRQSWANILLSVI